MFQGNDDKQKAVWLRDNLTEFWVKRFPNATLGGQTNDLLIDVEQQLQIEQALEGIKASHSAPRVDISKSLAAIEEVRERQHKISNEVMRLQLKLEEKLENISPKAEAKPIIESNLSLLAKVDALNDRTEGLNSSIKQVNEDLLQFKHMTLTQRLAWLIKGA